MPYAQYQPHPALRGLVRCYWSMEHVHSARQQEHRHLPERSVHLVFTSGHSWAELAGVMQPLPAARLEGMNLTPLRVFSPGTTRALGADLYPWGARQLFGWDASAPYHLEARYPTQTRQLSALVELRKLAEAQELLESWLLELLSEHGREAGKGVTAATQLYQTFGRGKIADIAEELNLSQRQLERQFVQEVGVGAKTLARLIRFEEVHNRLWAAPELPLATLAYDLGFSDQAHLNREFKALSAMTPGQFVGWTKQRSREGWATDVQATAQQSSTEQANTEQANTEQANTEQANTEQANTEQES